MPLYERDRLFAKLPARLPRTLVIHGERDAKTSHDAALRHAAALRQAGPVQFFTAPHAAHFVMWIDNSCAHHAVRSQCVIVSSSH